MMLSVTPSGSAPEQGNAPVAFVAGGSRGLGLLIAREFGARGYRLVVCSRDADNLARASADLEGCGYSVTTRVCDVSDGDAVEALVEEVEASLGPVEVMICVAGVIQVGPLAALGRRHFTEAIGIMLWGPINTALAVQARMVARGHGRIGIVSSIGGLVSVPHLLPYSTAKFGATGFAQGLRTELAGTGVTVTTIAPGLLRTGSHVMATFVGNQPAEYSWFAAGDGLPLLSMDAERAAARIVGRVLSGRAIVVLTPVAKVAMRVHGVAPALTSAGLELAARLLPGAPGARSPDAGLTIEGWQAARRLSPRAAAVVRRLTTLTSRAARRYNQPHATKDAAGAASSGSH